MLAISCNGRLGEAFFVTNERTATCITQALTSASIDVLVLVLGDWILELEILSVVMFLPRLAPFMV
jgi:hypothetical protein